MYKRSQFITLPSVEEKGKTARHQHFFLRKSVLSLWYLLRKILTYFLRDKNLHHLVH